jgi:hypothetical protein
MASRLDYVDAALDALAVVIPNEQPIRIVLREILLVIGLGWIDDRDPTRADFLHLAAALEKAVAAA